MSTASMPALHLDVAAHRLGPGLGAEDADLERASCAGPSLALELLDDHLHVARRDHDDVGLEVADQLHLLFGLAAAHRAPRCSPALGAVVRAQAAGEQAVAVGHVHHVAGAPARRADRARHQVGPAVDVAARVAHHGRLAGGARRGVHPHHLLARHGEHAERVVVAQVGLGGERELRQMSASVLQSDGCTPRASNAAGSAARCRRRAAASSAGAAAAAPAIRRGWRVSIGFQLVRLRVLLHDLTFPTGRPSTTGLPFIVNERPRNTATASPRGW
jgi:hypothetical protein